MENVKKQLKDAKMLFRSVPGWVLTVFVVSVICMNLFANKSITGLPEWLALDCGILFSGISFMSMDLIVKQFGPKASVKVSMLALFISVCTSVMFFIGGLVPGLWGESFSSASPDAVNVALDATVKGNWYIVFGSGVAFIVSSIVNAFTNSFIGNKLKKDNLPAFVTRSYVSTFIGQFVDNLTFALIVSQLLFGWTLKQSIFCALTGAVCELIFESLFTPVGWRVCKKWKQEGVGKEYLATSAKEAA